MKGRWEFVEHGRPVQIVIVGDDKIVSAGLRVVLENESDLDVVASAQSGAQALYLCRRLQPDLVLIDAQMPGLESMLTTIAVKEILPHVKVIILTLDETPNRMIDALMEGPSGYLSKDASAREVVSTVWQVLQGETSDGRPRW